jgi:Uncharacterized conserved protein (DUF2278)
MPIQDYGVLLGTLKSWSRETPNNQGKYRHAMFTLDVNGIDYTCAVDVDTKEGTVPVSWRVIKLRQNEWMNIINLVDGWHLLASNDTSGAVDYIRDLRLWSYLKIDWPQQDPFWRFRRRPWWKKALLKGLGEPFFDVQGIEPFVSARRTAQQSGQVQVAARMSRTILLNQPWSSGTSEMAFQDMQSMLEGQTSPRVIFFGAAFTSGNGVHDIHQNQGDPPPPPPERRKFYDNCGIWQDGLTIVAKQDGTLWAFQNKFGTQSDTTDGNGHPL